MDNEKSINENTCTALALPIEKYRHHLMKNVKDSVYIDRIISEMEIDQELGLDIQFEKTAKSLLDMDIDELTSSNDFYEVDKSVLSKLFRLNGIRFKCMIHNILESVIQTIKGAKVGLIFLLATALVICPTIVLTQNSYESSNPFVAMGVVLSWMLCLASLCASVTVFIKSSFNYEFISVDLDIQNCKETGIKIPYGAKLKMLDAKRSNIFAGFAIVTPAFKIKKYNYTEPFMPKFSLDPAIVGMTSNHRMFLITYWDIEADRQKVIADFKKFKSKKLKHV